MKGVGVCIRDEFRGDAGRPLSALRPVDDLPESIRNENSKFQDYVGRN